MFRRTRLYQTIKVKPFFGTEYENFFSISWVEETNTAYRTLYRGSGPI
ncbi:hypothetical protein HanPSC8_Chr14g0623481 [Helianthus annuus]|nr:hypothetical protein HanPSC8_Chr14g0623481 [Helianthus annuus]